MSAAESPQKDGHGGSTTIAAGLALFLVLYFAFPMVLLYPMFLIYGKGGPPPEINRALRIAFWPIVALTEKFPPYEKFIEKEGKLLGFP